MDGIHNLFYLHNLFNERKNDLNLSIIKIDWINYSVGHYEISFV